MAQSDLNVRLGLELRNFERGLKQAERALRRTAQSLQSLGSDISVAVTTPILAAGGASLKAAAEFEQLRNALIAVAGDADIAEEQLGRLRKIAEAPGVGFEQAVKASLQLQGLGFSAEQAENAITQVANAVAASGGGAEAFSGVVRQLGQIQAKNKVLQEDIGILLENAPILGQRLQEAFGARTAEQIAALGVNGEEFVQRLVGNLEQLERVQGGLANSFENFGIAVRFALADVGQQINELFNVQGIVDGFVRAIGDAVDVFRNLDDETKKSIVRFAGFAAAVGPTIFILGRLGGVGSTLIGCNRALTTCLVGNAGKFAVYTGAATTA
ncbi:MAG: tape measure protein, partial [Phaeodactylibacter sp.]|nr:tape measure protein [Phaeodactylibacter sp.]